MGIDWGAAAAWHLSLFRPDRVKGVVCLSVPYFPRDPNTKPTDSFRRSFGEDFYACQFQVTPLSLEQQKVRHLLAVGICRSQEEPRQHLQGMTI